MGGYMFELVTTVLIFQTFVTEVLTFSTQSENGGLEAADIAAIVLGVLLVVLIIVTVVVCILIKKGKLCVKEETPRVTPFLNGFSTTPGRLRDCSFRAINREKSKKRTRPRQEKPSSLTDTDSTIIYMYDDVYYSPDSRPLPGNRVTADPYPTHDPESSSRKGTAPRYNASRSIRSHSRENGFREARASRRSSRHSAPTPPPTPEAELKIPDNSRINITTSGRSPYVDETGQRY